MTRGSLKIGIVSTAKYFTPVALGKFIKSHPDIDLSLKITNRDNLAKRIQQNLDDLYILGQVPDMKLELEVIPFATNPLVVIANKNNKLVGRKVSLKELSKQPFIMREEGSGIRSVVEKMFSDMGLKVNERVTLETNEAIKHCVVGDLGVAVVSKQTLYLEGDASPVAILDVEGFPINKEWNIVHIRGKELSILAKEFLLFLKNQGAEYLQLDEL